GTGLGSTHGDGGDRPRGAPLPELGSRLHRSPGEVREDRRASHRTGCGDSAGAGGTAVAGAIVPGNRPGPPGAPERAIVRQAGPSPRRKPEPAVEQMPDKEEGGGKPPPSSYPSRRPTPPREGPASRNARSSSCSGRSG